MGQLKNSRLIIVILCLLLTSSILFWQRSGDTRPQVRSVSLAETITYMEKWRMAGDIPLAQNIVAELKLDDFIFRNFSNGEETLSLYIGYYNSRKKVGASHDPLVCFPGQGWVLSDLEQDELSVELTDGNSQLHYSTMIAEHDSRRQLLVYWFQAYDQSTTGTLAQKISLLRGKLLGAGEDNAFVRIGISLEGQTKKEAINTIFSFLDEFYPLFHTYVRNEKAL